VEPTPVLGFDLNGSFITFDGDTTITICSGEDFLIDNLVIPQTASNLGNLKYVEFDFDGDADFLDVMHGDQGVYNINNFQLGRNNVVNTSSDNSFQVTRLRFTPYFEDQDNTTTNFEECEGETIFLTVIINPAVPDIMAQDEVLCSSEELATPLIGGTGTGGDLLTILSGEVTFTDENNEFIIPAGANSITNIAFELDGANGGASTGAGNNGGAGYHFEGFLNDIFTVANNTNNNAQSRSSYFPIHPGDTIRTVLGSSGADGVNSGDGGDASSFIIYAGPNSSQTPGSIIYAFVAGGGGGAGANEAGETAFGEVTSLGASTSDGIRGASFGGFGGLGFLNGYTGGAGVSNGGGGGGGYAGGNGGGNLAAAGGEAGTNLNFGPTNDTDGRPKDGRDGTEGAASMSYTIVFDDVNFTLVDKTVAPGLVDLDPSNVTPGMTMGADTLLYGEAFSNPTNGPLTVDYELTTTTEAGCGDAGSFTYTLTIEPNATLTLTSGNTMITGSELAYEGTVCSGDQIEVFLGTDITTLSEDPADVYYEVSQINGTGVAFFDGTDIGTMFTGQAMPIRLFESGVINNTGEDQEVIYSITPYINQPSGDCEGETVMLTLTVQPGFAGNQIATPATVNVCSNSSLSDAGFDLDANLTALNNDFDTVLVNSIAVGTMSADFTSTTDVSATDRETVRSMGFFGDDVYRNLTGSDVSVTYTVQLVSAAGCKSLPFDYTFNIYAEPIIDTVPSPTNVFETTICSSTTTGSGTGLNVAVAGNSASVANYNYFLDLEMGLELIAGGSYPEAGLLGVGAFVMQNDEYENKTTGALTATYSVVAISDDGCVSDTVKYVVLVEPEPMTDVMLVAGDSTTTYGLFNARAFMPNPVFEICANQEIYSFRPQRTGYRQLPYPGIRTGR